MRRHWDIVLQDEDGLPAAIIEIRNVEDLTLERASEFHEQLTRGVSFERDVYFMLASQQTAYLWKHYAHGGRESELLREVPMIDLLPRLVPQLPPDTQLRNSELLLLLYQWLLLVVYLPADTSVEPEKSLHPTGFLDAITEKWIAVERAA